jgi:hypothetical protein
MPLEPTKHVNAVTWKSEWASSRLSDCPNFQARLSTWLHATASLGTIGKPVIELSHAQDYRGGMIV